MAIVSAGPLGFRGLVLNDPWLCIVFVIVEVCAIAVTLDKTISAAVKPINEFVPQWKISYSVLCLSITQPATAPVNCHRS